MSSNNVVKYRVPATPGLEGERTKAESLVGRDFVITSLRFYEGRLGEFAVVEGADSVILTPDGVLEKVNAFWFTTGAEKLMLGLHMVDGSLPAAARIEGEVTSSGHTIYKFTGGD